MSVIIIKSRKVLSLSHLNRMALRKIFEPKTLTLIDERLLDDSINAWSKKADITKDERRELQVIITALIKNEKGKFKEVNESYKRFDINYKQVYNEGL